MTELTPSPEHAAFLSLLPRLQTHARIQFRHLNLVDHEEIVADVVAYGFAAFLRLQQRGKNHIAFPAMVAHFVARAVWNGRGIVRRRSLRDPMIVRPHGERIHIHSLDNPRPEGGWWRDLAFDSRVRVDEQAAFNIDFPAWLQTLPSPKRQLAELLALGYGTADVALSYPQFVDVNEKEAVPFASCWSYKGVTTPPCSTREAKEPP